VIERRVMPVPPALRPWVADISVTSISHGTRTVLDLPDPATTLTIRADGRGRRDVFVTGPRTHAIATWGRPGPACMQLRLHPGAAVPVGPLRGIVDDRVGLPAGDLAHALATVDPGTLHDPATLRSLARVLADWPPPVERVRDAAQLLADGEPVHAVARKLGVSERQLRTLFDRLVGVSPKQYARLQRVRMVLSDSDRGDLAAAAVRAGYYDQSHMTTEFRRLVGVPPGAYASGRRPPATPCGYQAVWAVAASVALRPSR
jgi:AraC-like DNA-binding protein